MSNDHLIEARGIKKIYTRGGEEVRALDGISVDIQKGEYVSIIGPSGSGKSTFFNIVGGLDTPSEGSVSVEGYKLSDLDSDQLAWFRCHKIGFIFQSFNLIMTMTALENVAMGPIFAGNPPEQAYGQAEEVLIKVGLKERLNNLPSQVSGGQQQRIAIARALVNKPLIILADEPTGNLDLKTGQEIIDLLSQMKEDLGITIITATHDMKMLSCSDKIIRIESGKVVEIAGKEDISVTVGTIDGKTVA